MARFTKTPYTEHKETEEGIKTVTTENNKGGHDCKVIVPTLQLRSKKEFEKYNGVWPRTGYLFTTPKNTEEKENGERNLQ